MEKLEKLKNLIYQIIGKNPFLLRSLECIEQHGDKLPHIELVYQKSSSYSDDTIKLGLTDIIECYFLANEYKSNLKNRIRINPQNDENTKRHRKCKGIYIEMPISKLDDVELNIMESDFLNDDENIKICDALAIYSSAFSLYHEFGHALHDKFIPKSQPIARELAADTFAFEAVMSMHEIEDDDVLFMGVFVAIIEMLKMQNNVDDKHPHSIKRLYNLFQFWKIKDESLYWNHAYDAVIKWCDKNNLPITWGRKTFRTSKDKFIDAYACVYNYLQP